MIIVYEDLMEGKKIQYFCWTSFLHESKVRLIFIDNKLDKIRVHQ